MTFRFLISLHSPSVGYLSFNQLKSRDVCVTFSRCLRKDHRLPIIPKSFKIIVFILLL